MTKREIYVLAQQTLEEKIKQNPNFIRYSYFEVRVKLDLTEKETDEFLKVICNELKEFYSIYYKGCSFEYGDAFMTVQDNELLIAVKDKIK